MKLKSRILREAIEATSACPAKLASVSISNGLQWKKPASPFIHHHQQQLRAQNDWKPPLNHKQELFKQQLSMSTHIPDAFISVLIVVKKQQVYFDMTAASVAEDGRDGGFMTRPVFASTPGVCAPSSDTERILRPYLSLTNCILG